MMAALAFNGLAGNFNSLSICFFGFFCENAMKIRQVSMMTTFVLKTVTPKRVSVLDLSKAMLNYSPLPLLIFTWSFVPGT